MNTEETTRYFIDQKKGTISVCTSQGWITLPIDEQAFSEAVEGRIEALIELVGDEITKITRSDEYQRVTRPDSKGGEEKRV